MAIDNTSQYKESLQPAKARLAGAVATVCGLAATAAMVFLLVRQTANPETRADIIVSTSMMLALAGIGMLAGLGLLLGRKVGIQQFLLIYWLTVTVVAIAITLAVILWKVPADTAEQLGLEPASASKWIALVGLAMVVLGGIVVVLLTGASQQHSRQRYASMVIVAVSFAVAAVLAVNMLAEKKPLHMSLESMGRYSMSQRTRRILKDMKVPLRLTCVYTSTDKAMQTAEKRSRVLELLGDMKLSSDKITVDNVTSDGEKAELLERLRAQLGTQADAHRKFVEQFKADSETLQTELEKLGQTWKAHPGNSYLNQWGLAVEISSAINDGVANLKQTRKKVDAALGGSGLPDYADLVRQIKQADESALSVLEQSTTFVESVSSIAKAASDPNTQQSLTQQVKKFTDAVSDASAAINSKPSDPNDPSPLLEKYAESANAAADAATELAKALDNIAGPEQAKLVQQNTHFTVPMGPVSISLVTYFRELLSAQIRQSAAQASGVLKNTKADYQKKFIAQTRGEAAKLVDSAGAACKLAENAITQLGNVDKQSGQAFAAAEAGKLFADPLAKIQASLAAIAKLPTLKDSSISSDITGENIIIVEAGEKDARKMEVISFDEVWPLKVRSMGPTMDDQGPQKRQFNGDAAIGSRILELTSDPFALVLLAYWGPGPDTPPQMARMMPRSELPVQALTSLRKRLEAANFAVEQWNLNEDMPDPNDHKDRQKVLIVLPPAPPAQPNPFQRQQMPMPRFGPEHANKVTDAIADGMPAVFLATFSPPRQANQFMPPASTPYAWGQYLRDQWGVDVKTDHLVIPAVTDAKTPGRYKIDAERFNFLSLSSFTDQPIGKPLQGQRVMWANLCPITGKVDARGNPAEPPAGVTIQPVLGFGEGEKSTWATQRIQDLLRQFQSTEGSYISPNYQAGDLPVPFDLAVAATKAEDKEKGIKPVRIVVMTVGASLSDGYMDREIPVRDAKGTLSLADPPRANADLPINSVYWLIGRQGLIASGPVQATMREIPPTLKTVLMGVYCVALPLIVLGIGGLVMYRRKR